MPVERITLGEYARQVLSIAERWHKAKEQYPKTGVQSCEAEILALQTPESFGDWLRRNVTKESA